MGFGTLGIWEMLAIGLLVLLVFGPRRLPEIARSVGGALREFKRGVNEIQRELEESERGARPPDPVVPGRRGGPGERGRPAPRAEAPAGEVAATDAARVATTPPPESGASDPDQADLFAGEGGAAEPPKPR